MKPEDKRRYYSEQIIYLPNTYQPNDDTRVISKKVFAREDLGLPSNGLGICCFNNSYKMPPAEFDIGKRLLGTVKHSVFWLLKSNQWAEQNLKTEDEEREINAERVVFEDMLPRAERLARHKLANLLIHKYNVNVHTTAIDALWAGLLVVTA